MLCRGVAPGGSGVRGGDFFVHLRVEVLKVPRPRPFVTLLCGGGDVVSAGLAPGLSPRLCRHPGPTEERSVPDRPHWTISQYAFLGRRSTEGLVPDPDPVRDLSSLRRLSVRGAGIGTIDRALEAILLQWILLSCGTDRCILVQAQEMPRVLGMVAIATTNAALRSWTHAHHPEHLGEKMLRPTDPAVHEPGPRRAAAPFTRARHLQPTTHPLQETPTSTARLRRLNGRSDGRSCLSTPPHTLAGQ